jgi:hypothetical protein
LPELDTPKTRSITFRSIGIGLLLAIVIVCVTPFNDYVVNNSFLIGSYFPPVFALAMLALVLLINGPLHKFAPRAALSSGEMSIVILIVLVSCSIPSQGLMRQIIPSMVSPLYMSGQYPRFAELLKSLELPMWLFATDTLEGAASRPEVTQFYSRVPQGESIPWHLWIKPLIGWGAFVVCFMTALISLAFLVRFQWAVNERLAFPIAQLQSMLITAPKPGKAFNEVFASRSFWIAVAIVVVIQGSAFLNVYFPKSVPAIPFGYDFRLILTDAPWNSLTYWTKEGTIYFTLLGLTYFTPTRVSFSLWGIALIMALIQWPLNAMGNTSLAGNATSDQHLGAAFAFLGGILWIGRHHWMVILRALIGRPRPEDATGVYLRYRPASLLLIGSVIGMVAWFMIIGCVWWLACVIVLMILMAHLITARLVAETGLAYVRVPVGVDQIITEFPATAIKPTDAYAYGIGHFNFMQAPRESLLTFTLHSLQTIETSGMSPSDKRRVPSVIAGSLVVAFIACALASIWCYYSYAVPMDDAQSGVLNVFGTINWPKAWFVDFPTQVAEGQFPAKQKSTFLHIGIGIGVTVFLQAMTWRFAGWPLLPVGYLLCTNFYITNAAFSLFLGWLAKTLILRFGGATMFNNLKPFFIGLIFGEAISTGLSLIVTMLLAVNGYDFKVVRFLPQ